PVAAAPRRECNPARDRAGGGGRHDSGRRTPPGGRPGAHRQGHRRRSESRGAAGSRPGECQIPPVQSLRGSGEAGGLYERPARGDREADRSSEERVEDPMANTVLIADDEPQLAQDLARRLKRCWSDVEIVAVVENGLRAVAELSRLRPRYAFLDIR